MNNHLFKNGNWIKERDQFVRTDVCIRCKCEKILYRVVMGGRPYDHLLGYSVNGKMLATSNEPQCVRKTETTIQSQSNNHQ